MIEFQTVDGRTLVLRGELIGGAVTAATQEGPMIGCSQLMLGGSGAGPIVKATPEEVKQAVQEDEG